MREIKFKVWDNQKKKFVQDVPPHEYMLDHHSYYEDDVNDIYVDLGSFFEKRAFSGRLEFFQFTGWRDKCGQEIYEADVVSYLDNIYKVEWLDGAYILINLITGAEFYCSFEWHKNAKVIGFNYTYNNQ